MKPRSNPSHADPNSFTMLEDTIEDQDDREGTIVKHGRKKYVIHGLIDKTLSDSVYHGSGFRGKRVVFYAERIHDHGNTLRAKYNVLNYLEKTGFEHVPKVLFITADRKHNYLAQDKVGKSLHQLFLRRKCPFSLRAVILLTWKLVKILDYLHSTGVAHGLLTPCKILTAASARKKEELYLVGFRYAVNFVETPNPTKHLPIMDPVFASPTLYEVGHGTMKGDLESLFFSMVFLLTGSLPWIKNKSRAPFAVPSAEDPVYLEKKKISPEDLCHEMPSFMSKIYDYVRSLSHLERPCYKWIKLQFTQYFKTHQVLGEKKHEKENRQSCPKG